MALDAIKRILPSCFLAVAIAYFGFHALTGEQGVLNWIVVKNDLHAAEIELALSAKRWKPRLRACAPTVSTSIMSRNAPALF